jgi:hypothetical protein
VPIIVADIGLLGCDAMWTIHENLFSCPSVVTCRQKGRQTDTVKITVTFFFTTFEELIVTQLFKNSLPFRFSKVSLPCAQKLATGY